MLANTTTTNEQIAEKVKALRDARTKTAATYAAAQKAPKDVLTVRQEAVIITMGYLE